MPLQDFVLLQELGSGSFGIVHKCMRRADNKIYAIKQVKFHQLKQKDKQNALNQIRLLASLQNPYIISYKQAFYDQKSKNICIVMEFANQGDLTAKIKQHIRNSTKFKENDIWKTAYHLLHGCKKLHDSKIIHRDIKSANIFYSNGIAKLGDLNVSKYIVQSNFAKTQTGTPYYAAPQIWSDQPYGVKCDIWSIGIVIYEMCMLRPPFRAQAIQGLYRKIMIGDYEKIHGCYSKSLGLFISKCLTVDSKKRATSEQLLKDFTFAEQEYKEKSFHGYQLQNELLQTINIPNNISFLNDRLPASKYDQEVHKKQKKQKVIIFEEISNKMNSPRSQLPFITKFRSEKQIGLLPCSSKIIVPASFDSHKDICSPSNKSNKTIIKIKSTKNLNITKHGKQKKIQLQ